jgi:hypothetical protein
MGAPRLAAALTLFCLAVGCGDRSVDDGSLCELPYADTRHFFPQSIEREMDILIVLDTSPAAQQVWSGWRAQATSPWSRLIDALKTPKLNNKIPNVHIGVVSADLGAGSYSSILGCKPGGDGAKLQRAPRAVGCVPPKNPWIAYIQGVTNIDNPAVKDPIERVSKALECVADLGAGGCTFSQPLEAARRALDPKLNLNPGFLRKNTFLSLLFITAGDDCSAAKTQLFDPAQTQLSDPLGPLSTYRCFEFGVSCDCSGGGCTRTTTGPRTSCKPSVGWLHKVEDYVTFFKGLQPPGRVIASVVSGPTDLVDVQLENGLPILRPSCQTSTGAGTPAIRLEAFVAALKASGNKGYFNVGTDFTQTQTVPASICSKDFSPTVRMLNKWIVSSLGGPCVTGTLLTEDCGLACDTGVERGAGSNGQATCTRSCLHRADCTVELRSPYQDVGQGQLVARCPQALFQSPSIKVCSGTCPCWRLVTSKMCSPFIDGSPYRFEILRNGPVAKGEVAELTCATSIHKWGSKGALALPECGPVAR